MSTPYYAPADIRALVIPGLPADRGYTFSISAYRKVDSDIASSGQIISEAVSTTLYKPAEVPAFNGDIIGTIQGRQSIQVILNLENIASDAVLSTAEKPSTILNYNMLSLQLTALIAKANIIGGYDAEVSAAVNAKNELDAYLTSLVPSWLDTAQHTPIDKVMFQATWSNFFAAHANLQAAITGHAGVDGEKGDAGAPATGAYLTREVVQLWSYANGNVLSYERATTKFVVYAGSVDISGYFSLATVSNPNALNVAYNGMNIAVTGGFDMNEDEASVTIRATGSGPYDGTSIEKTFSLTKAKGGYEIVTALPQLDLFEGRMVYLSTDKKLYRYDGSNWTNSTEAGDIIGQLYAHQIGAGEINAAHINVTELSAISATIGTLRTATVGARTEISDNLIQVFDGNNVLRVRLGIWDA